MCNISAFILYLTTCIEKDRGLCVFIIMNDSFALKILSAMWWSRDIRKPKTRNWNKTRRRKMNANSKSYAVKNKILIWTIKKSLLLQIVTSLKRVSMGRAFTVIVWNLGHFTAKAEFLSAAMKRKFFTVNFLRLLVEICRFLRLTAKFSVILRSTPFTPLKNLLSPHFSKLILEICQGLER